MKKNINVNIFGNLYPIDEDAYELLLKYNENMRRYYANHEGGDEIADDVEHRVAELLSELKANGVQAITIEHVSDIIRRIGDPQDFEDNAETPRDSATEETPKEENQATTDGRATRKLFRDPEDKIVGGVVSGICHYLGIEDALIPRLLVVVLLFISFSTLAIIYLVAMVLIPEARTPEDRLRMYGKPVSAKAISEELMNGVNSARTFVQNPTTQDRARGCLSGLLRLILALFAISILLVLLGLFITFIVCAVSVVLGVGFMADFGLSKMIYLIPTWMTWTCITSLLCLILIPFFVIIRWLLKRADTPDMSASARITLFAAWLVALLLLIITAISIREKVEENFKNDPKEFLSQDCISMLNRFKMHINTLSGSDTDISFWSVTPDGEDPNDYHKLIQVKLDEDNDNDFLFDIGRSEAVSPGRYCIEGFVNSNGTGAVIYAYIAGDDTHTAVFEIPTYKTSNIKEMNPDSIRSLSYLSSSNPNDSTWVMFRDLASTYSWDYARLEVQVDEPGTLEFGYANLPRFSSEVNDVTCFKASQLKVRKLE